MDGYSSGSSSATLSAPTGLSCGAAGPSASTGATAPLLTLEGRKHEWTKPEIKLLLELVATYERRPIAWKEVANELQRQCPPPFGFASRTPNQCTEKHRYLRSPRPKSTWENPSGWTEPRWEQLKSVVLDKLKSSRSSSLTGKQWESVGKLLDPQRTGHACSARWKLGAPSFRSGPPSTGVEDLEPVSGTQDSVDLDMADRSESSPERDRPPPAAARKAPLPPPPDPSRVSASDQPFSTEDDAELLRLNAKVPRHYDIISHMMNPRRHEDEVRQRLLELLSPAPRTGSDVPKRRRRASMDEELKRLRRENEVLMFRLSEREQRETQAGYSVEERRRDTITQGRQAPAGTLEQALQALKELEKPWKC